MTLDVTAISQVVECIIGLLGSATNFCVLLAMYKERQLRTITNQYVGSLALSDLLVGLVIPPIVVAEDGFHYPKSFEACVVVQSLVLMLTQISVFNLLAIAIDRFLAIRVPFRYKIWMSSDRALMINTATWLLAMFIGLLPLFGWNNGRENFTRCGFRKVISLQYMVYIIFLCFTVPPLIIMSVAYVYIFIVVRKTKRAIVKLMVFQEAQHDQEKLTRCMKAHTRSDTGIILVIIMYILCGMPFHVVNCIAFSGGQVSDGVYLTTVALSHVNSVCNPFLFAFAYTKFKVTINKLVFRSYFSFTDETACTDNQRYARYSVKKQLEASRSPACWEPWESNTAGKKKSVVVHMLGSEISLSCEDSLDNFEDLDIIKTTFELISRSPFMHLHGTVTKLQDVMTERNKRQSRHEGRPCGSVTDDNNASGNPSAKRQMMKSKQISTSVSPESGQYDSILKTLHTELLTESLSDFDLDPNLRTNHKSTEALGELFSDTTLHDSNACLTETSLPELSDSRQQTQPLQALHGNPNEKASLLSTLSNPIGSLYTIIKRRNIGGAELKDSQRRSGSGSGSEYKGTPRTQASAQVSSDDHKNELPAKKKDSIPKVHSFAVDGPKSAVDKLTKSNQPQTPNPKQMDMTSAENDQQRERELEVSKKRRNSAKGLEGNVGFLAGLKTPDQGRSTDIESQNIPSTDVDTTDTTHFLHVKGGKFG